MPILVDNALSDKPRTRAKPPILARGLAIAGIVCVVLGTSNLFTWHQVTAGKPTLPNPKVTITTIPAVVAEQKVGDSLGGYTVPPDQPRSLRISAQGILGPIQRLGVTPDGALAVPTNINFAGWYVGSARPGDPGLSVIDGHITGQFSNGIFNKLRAVTIGSVIEIEFGDHSIRRFEVVDKQVLPQDKAAAFLFAKRPDIESQLNLITCSVFDRTTKTYTHRTVVVSKRLS